LENKKEEETIQCKRRTDRRLAPTNDLWSGIPACCGVDVITFSCTDFPNPLIPQKPKRRVTQYFGLTTGLRGQPEANSTE